MNLLKKFFNNSKLISKKSSVDQKVEAGISYTISKYSDVMHDLAKYDKGESES